MIGRIGPWPNAIGAWRPLWEGAELVGSGSKRVLGCHVRWVWKLERHQDVDVDVEVLLIF